MFLTLPGPGFVIPQTVMHVHITTEHTALKTRVDGSGLRRQAVALKHPPATNFHSMNQGCRLKGWITTLITMTGASQGEKLGFKCW